MLATLNIVISLIFVLLLFSLLASTVMEVIAAMLSLRAKHLRYTLENMLGEKVADFVRHPLFRQLSYATNRRARISLYSLPGYVSKDTFTAILQDIMSAKTSNQLEENIAGLDEGDLKRMMQFMFRQADGDPVAFKNQLERWFDEVMDRASDWYKRNLKWWLFGVGLVLAFLFNADTIRIYQNISSNATVQEFLVDMASNYAAKTDTVTGPDLENLTVEQAVARMDSALQQIEHIRSPLGLGWSSAETEKDIPWWLIKLAGLLLTGIAVTFGAPFWFDLLRKLLSLRGGGKAAEPEPAAQPAPPPPPPPAGQPAAKPPAQPVVSASSTTAAGSTPKAKTKKKKPVVERPKAPAPESPPERPTGSNKPVG
ncbi:MAG: hypothetical protein R3D58_00465 [Saprospiraceae bacterium]